MKSSKSDKLSMIALAVFRLNGQLVEWGNHFSSPHGLTSARWQVLGAMALAAQPLNIPQIGEAMGITRQGVLKQIKLLAEEGLVCAVPNPAHKRSPLYVLTDEGSQVFAAIQARWKAHAKALSSAFTDIELDAAKRVLGALSEAYVLPTASVIAASNDQDV